MYTYACPCFCVYLIISENNQVLALEHHFEIYEVSFFVQTSENGQTLFKCPDI